MTESTQTQSSLVFSAAMSHGLQMSPLQEKASTPHTGRFSSIPRQCSYSITHLNSTRSTIALGTNNRRAIRQQ